MLDTRGGHYFTVGSIRAGTRVSTPRAYATHPRRSVVSEHTEYIVFGGDCHAFIRTKLTVLFRPGVIRLLTGAVQVVDILFPYVTKYLATSFDYHATCSQHVAPGRTRKRRPEAPFVCGQG